MCRNPTSQGVAPRSPEGVSGLVDPEVTEVLKMGCQKWIHFWTTFDTNRPQPQNGVAGHLDPFAPPNQHIARARVIIGVYSGVESPGPKAPLGSYGVQEGAQMGSPSGPTPSGGCHLGWSGGPMGWGAPKS